MVVDTLSTWFIKNFGSDVAEKMVSDIPAGAYELAKDRSLKFFEGYNQMLYESFPVSLKQDLLNALHHYGLNPYDEKDIDDFEAVADMLATRRKIFGRS
ncbi:hypothetical protein ABIE69_003195 [Rhodobacteraceae bacterium MBR-64]|jgi:hypothetical protein